MGVLLDLLCKLSDRVNETIWFRFRNFLLRAGRSGAVLVRALSGPY